MKQKAHIGKANNQTFVQIPISELMNKLKYLCEYNGINYVEQEESYTSQADFFSNDYIPIFDEKDTARYTFSGKRITRGQYKSATGMVLNADVNGALNIMLKSRLGGSKLTILQSRGNLDMPVRIRVS
jgi:transposase